MFGRRICVIETGRTIGRRVDAAGDGRAPGAVVFSNACRSAGILARTQPVYVRAPDLRDRSRCTIGRRVDAAEDGRAPDAVAVSNASIGARAFLPAPNRCMFGRLICVIETGRTIGRRVDAAGDGRAPERRCCFQRVDGSAAILRRTQPVYVRAPDLRD